MNPWRQIAAALLVAAAAFAAFAVVPLFFGPGSRWPVTAAVAVLAGLALSGVASRRVGRLEWLAKTAVAGVTSLLAGLGLFVAFAAIALDYYDERARPWWLMSLWSIAVALIVGGVIGVLASASGRVQSRRTRHRRTG